MSEEILDNTNLGTAPVQDLPGAGGVLAMGIISIPFFGGLIGLILSIVTLVKSGQLIDQYNQNPAQYTEKSIKRVRAGRVCAIVSLSLLGLAIVLLMLLAATNAL